MEEGAAWPLAVSDSEIQQQSGVMPSKATKYASGKSWPNRKKTASSPVSQPEANRRVALMARVMHDEKRYFHKAVMDSATSLSKRPV